MSLLVRVKPRSSKSRILGVREGHLEVSLTAAPVDGKANAALCRLLADALDVPLRAVRIARGELSPKKQVTVAGLDLAALEAALARAT